MSTPVSPIPHGPYLSLASVPFLADKSPPQGTPSDPSRDRRLSLHHPGNAAARWQWQQRNHPHFAAAPHRGAYPWSNMPQWFRSGDKTRFAAYQAAGRPFFYLQQAGRHQVPLSGHLSPNEAPSTDRHTFKGLPHAFFWAPGAYVHVLNPVGEWSKTINTCAAIKQDTGQRAVWSCLLRLSAHTSRWPTDAELTVLMVSIACFLHGYGVPRDPMMAHNLAAAVPVKDRGRALALGRAYAQRHQVVGLCARLSPELGLDYFFETECAPEPEPEGLVQWMNPLRWPTLAGTLLMGALEYAFDGDHDPCQPEG